MKNNSDRIVSVNLSHKAMYGLIHAGIIDGRDKNVREGSDISLSRFISDLVERYVTDNVKEALINYYQVRIEEGNNRQEDIANQNRQFAEKIKKIKEKSREDDDEHR
ncbi:MAG: hypothetical protein V1866_04190 [archaeon]